MGKPDFFSKPMTKQPKELTPEQTSPILSDERLEELKAEYERIFDCQHSGH
ncbi:unnamed protein product [marine sediment metagenome]|uniref:Uncharacterized protein n=1 Tax=marine sediment metagenome TaxID=412755 RepID=X1CNX0_9ZZZZ